MADVPDAVREEFERALDAEAAGWRREMTAFFRAKGPPGPSRFEEPEHVAKVALAGPDGAAALQLLRRSLRVGEGVLHDVARGAVSRLIRHGDAGQARRLFTDAERAHLAAALSATTAAGELLGRARVFRRVGMPAKHAEGPTDFSCFAEGEHGLPPMLPHEALAYFKKLVPDAAGARPRTFGPRHERKAFTLAVDADAKLLKRVQAAIARHGRDGLDVSAGAEAIENLLDAAGVSPLHGQYAEMLYRTNAMESYNVGGMRALRSPQVRREFPVWRYRGVRDGRQGEDHEPHFDRYFSSSVPFQRVRGKRVFNCRCTFDLVSRDEWRSLRARGVRLTPA